MSSTHEVKKLGPNEYEITTTVPALEVKKATDTVAEEVGRDQIISGFRKGKAPADLVIRSVGEEKIKEEVVRTLIGPHLLEVLKEENLTPVMNPNVENFAFDFEKSFTFTTKVTTYPEVKITGYEKISVKKPEVKEVTDAEVEEVVNNLYLQMENPPERENFLVDSKGEKLTLGETQAVVPTDSFAQKMGATDLKDLKEKIKQNMKAEADVNQERDWETNILEELVKKTKVELPESLVVAEIDNILRKIVYDISSMGTTFEDYLKSQKKTIEDLKKEYRDSAIKTLTAQLSLNELAREKKFEVSDSEVEQALPKEADDHVHTATERTQMHSWLIQRKALAYLKSLTN